MIKRLLIEKGVSQTVDEPNVDKRLVFLSFLHFSFKFHTKKVQLFGFSTDIAQVVSLV